MLTDFGLATDARDGATSVHGGTVSYMAPELLRGGRSSVASDVWALGVVMHEIVFGEKPRWARRRAPRCWRPSLGRKLTDGGESSCWRRAAPAPFTIPRGGSQCPRRGGAPADRARRPAARRGCDVARRAALVAGLALAMVGGAAAIAVSMVRAARPRADAARGPSATRSVADRAGRRRPPTGPRRRRCWPRCRTGFTARACSPIGARCASCGGRRRAPRTSIGDARARRRRRSSPAAYAEGCPDLSPDGQRLRLPGARAGRARVRVRVAASRRARRRAGRADRRAVDGVRADVAGRRRDVLLRHRREAHGRVLDRQRGRMNVLPDVTTRSFITMFRYVVGERVFLGTYYDTSETEIVGIAVPLLKEEERFRVAGPGARPAAGRGGCWYFAQRNGGRGVDISEVDVATHDGAPNRAHPRADAALSDDDRGGLAFVSIRPGVGPVVARPNGAIVNLTKSGHVWDGSRCGRDLIVSEELEPEKIVIERLDAPGRRIEQLSQGPRDWSPACSPDGKVWFYRPHAPQPERSGAAIMRRLPRDFPGLRLGLAASPDGKRLAFVTMDKRGTIVQWIGADGGEPHEVAETETRARSAGRPTTRSGCHAGAAASSSGRRSTPTAGAKPADRSREPRLCRRPPRPRLARECGPAHRLRPDVAAAARAERAPARE